MFKRKKRVSEHSEESQRQLYTIRKLTRELIKNANESERSCKDGEATTPQDLEAVRNLMQAQKALLGSMRMAMSAGVGSDDIRTHGIDHAVSQSIVVSELAHFVVGEIKSRT